MKKFQSKNITIEWRFKLKDKIRENFSNRQWADLTQHVVNHKILDLVQKGLSPVARARKLKKYSDSYIAQIKGQIKFFTNKETGGVFFVKPEGQVKIDKETGALYTPISRFGKVQREKFEQGLGYGKNVTPVNLTLTGSMLSNYDSRPGNSQMEITLGIHKDAPELDRIKAKAHNEGTDKIPARKFIPTARESYTKEIMLEISKLFSYCLDQALKRGRTSK